MTTTPVRECLQTLSRHFEAIERGMTGELSVEEGTPASTLSQLRHASAIREVGDCGYLLHPKLREYLSDHLQLFSGYQSLAEIGSKISQIQALWNELEEVRGTADSETLFNLESLLRQTVHDINYAMDHNVLLLQSRLSIWYGNVKSLEAKKSQNRWYQKQTMALAADINRLAREAERVEQGAHARRNRELSSFLQVKVISRVANWQTQLSEMQTTLRRELFRTRQVEQDYKLLAKMDMVLRQQPSWAGFEPELPEVLPDFLLAARLKPLQPHAEPLDSNRLIADELEALAKSLPPRVVPVDDTPKARTKKVVDTPKPIELAPEAVAVSRLLRDIKAAERAISLHEWRITDPGAMAVGPDVWLIYAAETLRGRKIRVALIHNPPKQGEHFSHTFRDVLVHPALNAGNVER